MEFRTSTAALVMVVVFPTLVPLSACTGTIGDEGPAAAPIDGLGGGPDDVGGPGPEVDAGIPPVPVDEGPVVPLRRLTDTQYNNMLIELFGETDWAIRFVGLRGLRVINDPEHFSTHAETQTITEPVMFRYLEHTFFPRQQAGGINVQGMRFGCDGSDSVCADHFIEGVGSWMFRRPIRPEEQSRLRTIYDDLSDLGHEEALRTVLEALLTSPHFLYINEAASEDEEAWAVAARLSFFLWDRAPDEELQALARDGSLMDPPVLRAQAERLLAHERALPVISRFYAQLLKFDEPPSRGPGTPSPRGVQDSFAEFLQRVYRGDDASLEDLLTLPTSFVGTALEASYGDADYPGLLGHPHFTWTHSTYNTSDPIHRGVLVRERILCQELPPPPPDVEAILPAFDPDATTRERFAAHRMDPSCSRCHSRIDPLGFGFEHFDQMGRYRATENGRPVDASGDVLGTASSDGPFTGVAELGARLAASSEAQHCIVEQWTQYALGRDLRPSDEHRLAVIQAEFDRSGHDLRELLLSIATSEAVRQEDE